MKKILLFISASLIFSHSNFAVNRLYVGGLRADWDNPGVWSPYGVPQDVDDITIFGPVTFTMKNPGSIGNCRSLYIGGQHGQRAEKSH